MVGGWVVVVVSYGCLVIGFAMLFPLAIGLNNVINTGTNFAVKDSQLLITIYQANLACLRFALKIPQYLF